MFTGLIGMILLILIQMGFIPIELITSIIHSPEAAVATALKIGGGFLASVFILGSFMTSWG